MQIGAVWNTIEINQNFTKIAHFIIFYGKITLLQPICQKKSNKKFWVQPELNWTSQRMFESMQSLRPVVSMSWSQFFYPKIKENIIQIIKNENRTLFY